MKSIIVKTCLDKELAMLRDFLYINNDQVSNYLSILEGYLEQELEEIETETNQKGAKLSVPTFAEGSGTLGTSKQTKRKLSSTDSSKFEKLYNLLEKDPGIKFLDLFDEDIWSKLQRGDIIEVQAKISIPTALSYLQLAKDVSPLIEVMQRLGKDPLSDPKTKEAFTGINLLNNILGDKNIPLIFESASTSRFHFWADLERRFIQYDLNTLQGEAFVFGKIHRFIQRGKKETVFCLLPNLGDLSKLAKRNAPNPNLKEAQKNLITTIKGPAIVMTPIAVYR